MRLSNDLRTVELLCIQGYMLQAMTVAASIHELAHVVAFIGADDAKATRWETHDEMKYTYPSLSQREKTVRAALVALGFQGDELEDEFKNQENTYKMFCAAKHGNPVLLRDWGRVTVEGQESIIHGPFFEERTPQQARQVLYATTKLLWYACGVYAFEWYGKAPPAEREQFRRRLRRLEELIWRARFAPRLPPPRAV